MQHLKVALIAIIMSVVTFFMFFIGLGITLFILITLAIVGACIKATSQRNMHTQNTSQWRHYFTTTDKSHQAHSKHSSDIIEGNYEVVDN